MSTQKTTTKTKDNSKENGKSEVQLYGNHIEVPASPEFRVDVQRKQTGEGKMFLDVYVRGPVADTKNHKIKIEYPSYSISVPELLVITRKALAKFKDDYIFAQKQVMKQTDLNQFFLA